MPIKIIAFGQIAEITGSELTIEAKDVSGLKVELNEKFPSLSNKKYAIAVNKKMISVNVALTENDIVALMPPYSGG